MRAAHRIAPDPARTVRSRARSQVRVMLRTMVTKRSPRAVPLAQATAERARLAAAQADLAEQNQRGRAARDAGAVEAEWTDILRTVRAGMLAVPSRVAQWLPHLSPHDISEIDAEVMAALGEVGRADQT